MPKTDLSSSKSVAHLLVLLCFIFGTTALHAQEFNTESDVKFINDLSTTSLIWNLEEKENNAYNALWLGNDTLRHTVIRRLDKIIDEKYELWLNPKIFEQHLLRLIDSPNGSEELAYLSNIIGLPSDSLLVDGALNKKAFRNYKDALFYHRWDILISYLQMDKDIYNDTQIAANVSCLEKHTTLQYLSSVYEDQMQNYPYVSKAVKRRNFKLIKEQLAYLEDAIFVHYKSAQADHKNVKEIQAGMLNDNQVPGGFNQDRDYTGGGKLTISTDLFAGRWLNLGWLRYIGKDRKDRPHPIMMSYQSLSVGMKFYTPYIRYRNNFDLADSLFQHDRPFASFVFLERSKYRLWPKGLIRNHGTFQIGKIGTDLGRDIQAVLHQDAAVQSQKVYGWQNQVGQGGRWLIQLNQEWDFLLFSTTNKYHSFVSQNWRNKRHYANSNFGLNVIGTSEVMFGGYMTAYGGGLRLSSSDFTKQSGTWTLKPFGDARGKKSIKPYGGNVFEFGISLDAGFRYRRIVHNTMLEGFGYNLTYKDDQYDDESESVYTLNQAYYEQQNELADNDKSTYDRVSPDVDQVNRDLLLFDFNLNLRFRKMMLFWHVTLQQREFTDSEIDFVGLLPLVQPEDQSFYLQKTIPELQAYRDKKFYGFGTVGATWLLGN